MKRIMTRNIIVAALCLLGSQAAMAAVIPNASQLLQEQQNRQEQLLKPQEAVLLEGDNKQVSGMGGEEQVWVKRIDITGNTRLDGQILHALVADAEGQRLNLSQLQALAQRLTDYHREQGYPYTRAYLPAQNLSEGVVSIAILEAKYDQVTFNNQSAVKDGLIAKTLAPLQSGQIIESSKLERQLKLINRLGVGSRNVVSAGGHTGSSNLHVDVLPAQTLNGYVGIDNHGNEYTSKDTESFRFNAGVSANHLLGLGDRLSLDMTSTGSYFNYGKVAYEWALNCHGTRMGLSHSYLAYELGHELKELQADGSAAQTSLWISHPLILNNRTEVIATTSFDHKNLKDDVGLAKTYRHRKVDTGRVRLDAFHFDNVGGGGLNQFGLGVNVGTVDFTNEQAKQLDAQTNRNQGSFKMFQANLSRLQSLNRKGTQLYVGLQGQYSPDNLESDDFSAGGPYSISGYKNSVISGSSGYHAIVELRQNLINTKQNQLNGQLFIDTAQVKHIAEPWAGVDGSAKSRINSFGVGLNWSNAQKWSAQARVGIPFGPKPSTVDKRNDAQAWLNVTKWF